MVLTDQPTAPRLDRSELAGAQQVMDELSGDAQQFGGLLRAVGEPFGEGVTIEDSRIKASSSSRMSLARSRAIALVLSSTRSAGAVTSLPALFCRAMIAALTSWKWRIISCGQSRRG